MNVQAAIKGFDFNQFNLDAAIIKYKSGCDMIRLPFDSKIEFEIPVEDDVEQQNLQFAEWSSACGIPNGFCDVELSFSNAKKTWPVCQFIDF